MMRGQFYINLSVGIKVFQLRQNFWEGLVLGNFCQIYNKFSVYLNVEFVCVS